MAAIVCSLFYSFLPSLMSKTQDIWVIVTWHQTCPPRSRCVQAGMSFCTEFQGVDESFDVHGCLWMCLVSQEPFTWWDYFKWKGKRKHQVNEKTWHRYPGHLYIWLFCALNKGAHPGVWMGLKCSVGITGQVIHPGGGGLCLWREEGQPFYKVPVCIDLIKNTSLMYSMCLHLWGRLTSFVSLSVDQKLQEDQKENVCPLYLE